ncbi:MAG TPA: glycosyltransferase [Williamwhitmania sp.]|nr:glycosyltransferase [Williamwhitmania sp.]
MKLSIIIVSYNVKDFLDQCLLSVKKAINGIDAEVFVVDNLSVDGSSKMVREHHSWAKLIENDKNSGFAVANNQAIRQSSGEYVLLLNPDTLVQEHTFTTCIQFMDSHPEAGALGVKMIDGKGAYLPESKRGLPTPAVAFYKISGLIKLFPRSKRFAHYYLGHLSKNETHEIEILAGAFMFMRTSVLAQTGLLDEAFFMYGEDIDLSYRILKAGYKNYYTPETSIIHYKGESTKKGSINYVVIFYKAMILFAKKHFNTSEARYYSTAIYLAIYLRAALSLAKRAFQMFILPLADASVLACSFLTSTLAWEVLVKDTDYARPLLYSFLAGFILTFVLAIFLSGGYDRPLRQKKVWKGVAIGAVGVLIIYTFLPESIRFSRAIITISSVTSLLLIPLTRGLIGKVFGNSLVPYKPERLRKLILSSPDEAMRIKQLIELSGAKGELLEQSPWDDKNNEEAVFSHLAERIRVEKINELIISSSDISSTQIVLLMLRLSYTGVSFKLAPPKGISLIGSNSIETAGDLYSIGQETLASHTNRRLKRLLDIVVSIVLLLTSPLWITVGKRVGRTLKALTKVLVGAKTMVGYHVEDPSLYKLPKLKTGIFSPTRNCPDETHATTTNLLYAKSYSVALDFSIIARNIRMLIRGSF